MPSPMAGRLFRKRTSSRRIVRRISNSAIRAGSVSGVGIERIVPISSEDGRPKTGTLVTDQKLATAWLSSKSTKGMAFEPYLVEFKGGTAISFYKDGKVRSGTLASKQDLVKSVDALGASPRFETIHEGAVVHFTKEGFLSD